MMLRGPLVHGLLLLAALGFAYQTWTRETPEEHKTGTVEVWTVPPESITAVLYETKDRTVRIERRSDDSGSYLWGVETTVIKVRPPRKASDKKPPEPTGETKTTVREFPVGSRGDEALKAIANLRALRDLGELSDDDKEKYKLLETTDTVAVLTANGKHSLILGGRIFGGSDRYVQDTASGRGYAIVGQLVRPFHSGETGLNLRKIHSYEDKAVAKVKLTAAAAGDKSLELIPIETETEHGKKKGWADTRTPDKADQTIANVLKRIGRGVRPRRYDASLDTNAARGEDKGVVTKVVEAFYLDAAGKQIGRFELYKRTVTVDIPTPAPSAVDVGKKSVDKKTNAKAANDKKPTDKAAEAGKPDATPVTEEKISYFVVTERTHTFGSIAKTLGKMIENDVTQLLSQ